MLCFFFSVNVKVGYIKAAVTFTPVSFTFSTTFMMWLCLDARSALRRTSSVTRNCSILCHNCNILCHNCKMQYPLKYDTERRAPSIDFCNAQTHTRARANKHTHTNKDTQSMLLIIREIRLNMRIFMMCCHCSIIELSLLAP